MNTGEIRSKLIQMGQDPKKSLGQHFLTSEAVVKKMVKVAQISPEDTILEIGPGLGILTRELAASPTKRLYLCEKDHKLCDQIKGEFIQNKMKIICDDALLLIPNLQVESPFKVVSNLPYNVGAPILISLLTICPTLPQKIVVMLQKEVAQRICAKPGDSNRGLLTVLIELYGEASIVEKVPSNLFYPVPQVDSAVLLIDEITPIEFNPKVVIRTIKMAFSGKRKKLKNSIFSTLKILPKEMEQITQKAGVSPDQRPEDLNRDQWIGLIRELLLRD